MMNRGRRPASCYPLGLVERGLFRSAGLVLAGVLLVWCLFGSPSLRATDDLPTAGTEADGLASQPAGEVFHVEIDSVIHPVAADFLKEAIMQAEAARAAAFVLELSTPGGLVSSTRDINSEMLSSSVPMIVYVSPSGAHAASAGFFMLLAGDVAAMAPGTNTGAAHPVSGQGQDIEGDLGEKIEQDAAAYVRSLAKRLGRDEQLAESAVLESRSFSAEEALEMGLVDVVTPNLSELLRWLEGHELRSPGKATTPLRTQGAVVRKVEMSTVQKLLSLVAQPNIAYALVALGIMGVLFELSSPGTLLPGLIGGVCLVLASFALSVLPVNFAGIALIALAVVFFVAELKVTSFGLLTVAGVACLVLGSLNLFQGDQADPSFRVSLGVIVGVAALAGVVVGGLMWMVLKAHRRPVRSGVDGLLAEIGVARTDIDLEGKVFVHGELWNSRADQAISAGEEVQILGVEGMTLYVRGRRD